VLIIDRVDRRALTEHGRPSQLAGGNDALSRRAAAPCRDTRSALSTPRGVGERQEGRLQFRGPSATSGYLDNPEKTRELFDGPWLNSGDRAYAAGGDVFITGRSKDIVIRAGRHIYPEEIEAAIGNLEGIRKGCVAVFGAADPRAGTEQLVVVAETRLTEADALARLRQQVGDTAARLLDAPPEQILLVPPGSVPKTSSGTLRRAATRDLFVKHAWARGSILHRGSSFGWCSRVWRCACVPDGACFPIWSMRLGGGSCLSRHRRCCGRWLFWCLDRGGAGPSCTPRRACCCG
jgi:acyl-CoA synthetase (AMP-forming)/AMP-acid ligase II